MLMWIRIAIISAVFLALLGFHLNAIEKAEDRVNKKWEAAELKKDLERQEKEKTILDNALALEREKNEEITKLNLTVNGLRYSLRNRPSRETIRYVEHSEAPRACTGAELSREDGEFLAGEAARAAVIAKERDYYYQQYEQVRKIANESINN